MIQKEVLWEKYAVRQAGVTKNRKAGEQYEENNRDRR